MEKNFIFKGGITKYWWIPMIGGLLSIAIGIWCLFSPDTSLPVLALAFAWVMVFIGIFNMVFALSNTRLFPGWGWSLAMGILEIICGVWMLCLPELVLTEVFIYVVAFYLIFACINAICDACTFYGYSRDWFGWLMAFLLITLFFAAIFLAGPVAGGIAVWLYIGIGFICFGIYRIMMSAKIRRINRRIRF